MSLEFTIIRFSCVGKIYNHPESYQLTPHISTIIIIFLMNFLETYDYFILL